MKSMFIAICMMVSLLSQTTWAAEPPMSPRVTSAFETAFTGAEDVQWNVVENLYKVNFSLDDRPMFAFFNAQGEMLVTGKYLTVKQLPKTTQKMLTESAQGYTVEEVFEINDGQNSKYYATITNESEQKVLESSGGKWKTFKKNSK